MAPAETLALGAEQRRFLIVETVVNSILSGLLSAGFVWLIFGGRDLIPLWGTNGLAFDLVPTVFMITLMMTLGLTLFTRLRCSKGRAPMMEGRSRLPRNVVLRALAMALAATIIVVPLSVGLLALIGPQTWTYSAVMLFKIVLGVVLAAIITPVIVAGAMRDVFLARSTR
jgi:hypothetical protein